MESMIEYPDTGDGAHHRAAAINMLRQDGARAPRPDYARWMEAVVE